MIKLTATARVHSISPVIDIPSKTGGQPFQKRELILDDSWEKDGKRYPNFVLIEFSGDAMAQLNNIYPGQRVSVTAYVNGREWNGRILNSIRGSSVTPEAAPAYQQPTAAYPQQQAPYPQQGYQQAPYPQQAPAPSPAYPQQPAYGPAPAQPYQQPQGYQQPQSPGVADLPWTPT